jgi:hypothetical protein
MVTMYKILHPKAEKIRYIKKGKGNRFFVN